MCFPCLFRVDFATLSLSRAYQKPSPSCIIAIASDGARWIDVSSVCEFDSIPSQAIFLSTASDVSVCDMIICQTRVSELCACLDVCGSC